MSLRRVGHILHYSKSRRLIARLTLFLQPQITVFDYKMRRIGVLVDVFGPVKRPYASIRPDPSIQNPQEFVGQDIYVRIYDLEKQRRRGR